MEIQQPVKECTQSLLIEMGNVIKGIRKLSPIP